MFSLGLDFNLRKLSSTGLVAIIASLIEILLMIWIGYEIARFFAWKINDAIFLGGILAISSTTIIVKALKELGLEREYFAQLIYGILIIEDILAIGLLASLSSIAISHSLNAITILVTMGKLLLFLLVMYTIGIKTIPRLLSYVAQFQKNEMLLITVLGLCFGFCLITIKFEYSIALGAFTVGAIMSEAKELDKIEHLIEPIHDMFSAIFFVSIGLLLDPKVIVNYALPIIVITLAVIFGKILSCSFGTFIAGKDGRTSLRVGMGLAQIGEFSFIIASLGISLNVTSQFLYPIAVAVSVITTFLTPYLIRCADPLSNTLAKILPKKVGYVFGSYTNLLQRNKEPQEQIKVMTQEKKVNK
jgi:CPA2 family monovalent cation:H+ antiporter-2